MTYCALSASALAGRLKSLHLRDANPCRDGLPCWPHRPLWRGWKNWPSSRSEVGDDDAAAMAHLAQARLVRRLNLSFNRIGPNGASHW